MAGNLENRNPIATYAEAIQALKNHVKSHNTYHEFEEVPIYYMFDGLYNDDKVEHIIKACLTLYGYPKRWLDDSELNKFICKVLANARRIFIATALQEEFNLLLDLVMEHHLTDDDLPLDEDFVRDVVLRQMDKDGELSGNTGQAKQKEQAYIDKVREVLQNQFSVVGRVKIVKGEFDVVYKRWSRVPFTCSERKDTIFNHEEAVAAFEVRIHGAFLEGLDSREVFVLTEFEIEPQEKGEAMAGFYARERHYLLSARS